MASSFFKLPLLCSAVAKLPSFQLPGLSGLSSPPDHVQRPLSVPGNFFAFFLPWLVPLIPHPHMPFFPTRWNLFLVVLIVAHLLFAALIHLFVGFLSPTLDCKSHVWFFLLVYPQVLYSLWLRWTNKWIRKLKSKLSKCKTWKPVGGSLGSKADRSKWTSMVRELSFRQNEFAVTSLGQGHTRWCFFPKIPVGLILPQFTILW